MLNWGIVSTGRIAGVFARGVLGSKKGKLVAVASRSLEKAQAWGKDFLGDKADSVKRYGSYEELFADKNVHAVYIATPHHEHPRLAIMACEAKKHVIVEKPIAINHADAMLVIEAARRNGVALMEAFMYRCHPLVAKTIELIKAGEIGQVRAVQSAFSFNMGKNPGWENHRLLNNTLGGGGILDVGCYPVSFTRLIAGAAFGLNNSVDPVDLKATGVIGSTGVDEYAVATAKFVNGSHEILAEWATGVQVNMENVTRIYGDKGKITVGTWVPADTGNKVIVSKGKDTIEHACDADVNVYALEADRLADVVERRAQQADWPAMSWSDTLGNMKTLDRWRQGIGQQYESEKPAARTTPITGKPLAVRSDNFMQYGKLPGLDKPISRLLMGVDNQRLDQFSHAAAMFDDYFERGGNTFDSAYVYGGGQCERALGQWVKSRNLRDKVVILDKGAHTPQCDPVNLTRQLKESLDRLQMDHMDIYMMHRDNLDIPVGEFVDVLNEHKAAGRIKIFGGSNWTTERIEAFNDYARKNGKTGFVAISNNLSLARMVDAPWPGCISVSDPKLMAWHRTTKMPLIPWSSQARGFFTLGDPNNTADKELVRCWYSDDNFKRQARAKELAAKKGVTPIQIALAYVLNQEFPTFALIGPRSIEETRTSFDALKIQLTPQEVRWLNLEA